jgi:hypothetical protein
MSEMCIYMSMSRSMVELVFQDVDAFSATLASAPSSTHSFPNSLQCCGVTSHQKGMVQLPLCALNCDIKGFPCS